MQIIRDINGSILSFVSDNGVEINRTGLAVLVECSDHLRDTADSDGNLIIKRTKCRKCKYHPIQENGYRACDLFAQAYGIAPDECVREIARAYGYIKHEGDDKNEV